MYEQIERLVDFLKAYDGWVKIKHVRHYFEVKAYAKIKGKTYGSGHAFQPGAMLPDQASFEVEKFRVLFERTVAAAALVPDEAREPADQASESGRGSPGA